MKDTLAQAQKAQQEALDANETIGGRTLSVLKENTDAFFGLFSKALTLRQPQDVSNFVAESAKVARQNLERSWAVAQQNTQDVLAYGKAWQKEAQDKVQDTFQTASKKTK